MSTVKVNPEMTISLLRLSTERGTQDTAISMAEKWIQQAAKEIERLGQKLLF